MAKNINPSTERKFSRNSLTLRERQVLELLASGLAYKQIADALRRFNQAHRGDPTRFVDGRLSREVFRNAAGWPFQGIRRCHRNGTVSREPSIVFLAHAEIKPVAPGRGNRTESGPGVMGCGAA